MYSSYFCYERLLVLHFLALAAASNVPRQLVDLDLDVAALLSAAVEPSAVKGPPSSTIVPLYTDAVSSVVSADVTQVTGVAGVDVAGLDIGVSVSVANENLLDVTAPALDISAGVALTRTAYAFATSIVDVQVPDTQLTHFPSLISISILPTLTLPTPLESSLTPISTTWETPTTSTSSTVEITPAPASSASSTSNLVKTPPTSYTPEVHTTLSSTLKLSFKFALPSSSPVSHTEMKLVFKPASTSVSASTHASSSSAETTQSATTSNAEESTTVSPETGSSSGIISVKKNAGLELLLGLTVIAAVMAAL